MQMTDLSFLLYFLPVMLLVYFALLFSRKAQNLWLVISSLLLYAFGNLAYLALLFIMALANYYLGYAAQKRREAKSPTKRIVVLTVALNLLPLFLLKYLHPIMEGVAGWFSLEVAAFPVVPFGISFLALQGISYVVDISRGTAEWNHRFTDAMLYLVFFPPLQAGPLIRYQDVARQIQQREIKFDRVAKGLGRFIVGLGKIVLLGNTLLKIADIVFEQSNNSGVYTTVPVSLALLGLVSYAPGPVPLPVRLQRPCHRPGPNFGLQVP